MDVGHNGGVSSDGIPNLGGPGGPGLPPGPGAPGGGTESVTIDKSKIKPSGVWYWIGSAILVLGCGGALVWFIVAVVGLNTQARDYQRIDVPGQRSLTFSESGTYTLFGETATSVSSSTLLDEPDVTVKNSSGSTVTVNSTYYYSSSTYNVDNYHGKAFADVHISSPGTYEFTVRRPASTTTAGRDVNAVAVGQTFTNSSAAQVFGSMAVGFVAFVIGLIVLLVVAVKRSGSRKRQLPPKPRYPSYPGAFGGPYPAYPAGPYPTGPYPGPRPGPYGGGPPGAGPYPGAYPGAYAGPGPWSPPGAPPSGGPPPSGPPVPGAPPPWAVPPAGAPVATPPPASDPFAPPTSEPPAFVEPPTAEVHDDPIEPDSFRPPGDR